MKYLEEKLVKFLMVFSVLLTLTPLILIIGITVVKGGGALINNPEILIKVPGPKYLLGGEGGFFHAIMGSFYMVLPATIIASLFAVATAIFLQLDYSSRIYAGYIRIILDILWGTPSIIYGVFILVILIFLQQRGCLLAGIFSLTLLEFPIITRYADEAISCVPKEIRENTYSMGATRWETSVIKIRYALPGIIAGILIGLGRGLGDAAAVIFTTGTGNSLPGGLLQSATALPVIIYQQANSFYVSVRDQAYAASFLLIVLFFIINVISRHFYAKFSKYVKG
ncbi:MAG: ABC transporter permease subunit [Candidatus Marinimicrobia bacterium]|nr:ABC transporter permease subunit [Candidatus Neomarinimicrobiota bacterium]